MSLIEYSSNGLSQFRADPRFSQITGQGQTVAVIDVGFNTNHTGFGADLNNDGVRDKFIRTDLDFTSYSSSTRNVNDGNQHGLQTSSVVSNIATGARLLPIQTQTCSGVTAGIEYAIQNKKRYGITVVNISLGDTFNTEDDLPFSMYRELYSAVGRAEQAGISVVAAAGNSYRYFQANGSSGIGALNNIFGSMATASNGVTESNRLADFSQRREDLIGAPGAGIQVFRGQSDISRGSGTSFSTPFISGSISLLQGVAQKYMGRHLSNSEMKSVISQTDTLVSESGRDFNQINVYKAADLIYDIGTHAAKDTLLKSPLTNSSYTNPRTTSPYENTLYGGGGYDTLVGRSTTKNTFLYGGGAGSDLLVGGTGKNVFDYNSIADGKDDILHFTPGKDKLDISTLLDRINYTGSNPLKDGIVKLGVSEVTNVTVSIDQDGVGAGAPQVLATLVNVSAGAMCNPGNFIF